MRTSVLRFCLLALLALLACPALAEHTSFMDSQAAPEFPADYLVSETMQDSQSVVTVTFAGDCTLGGTERSNRQSSGLTKTVLREGLAYPFSGLYPLFSQDDLTLVNLEGVLSDDSQGENTEKEFAFRGPAVLAQTLPLGSVEAVNLANNHTGDYGEAGREATRKALSAQGIAYAGQEWLCVYQVKGIKIGLGGTGGTLNEARRKVLKKQIALLKEAGCQVILYSMHAGQEYAENHNGAQQELARFLIDAGADAVIGHHPHVVQGVEIYHDRYIFYSLGNCVFGGNHDPRETGALAAVLAFTFENGRLESIGASLHPFAITGSGSRNDFCPQLKSGKAAEKILKKVQQDTSFPMPAFTEGEGAVLPPLEISSEQ